LFCKFLIKTKICLIMYIPPFEGHFIASKSIRHI
jgi:hypothetical protein